MELQITLLAWTLQFKFHFGCDFIKHYPNKSLLATTTTILNTMNVTSEEQCVMSCYYDNPGCLAVNVITTDDVIKCEMTTGLSNEIDMVDDSTSVLYVTDYNQCAEDPGFCLNGGTCQPTWTSARCHCTDRFQGDRCDTCSERFLGDDACVIGYYGDTCGYRFMNYDNAECLSGNDLDVMVFSNPGFEDCMQWYANDTDCGGFVVSNEKCLFKGLTCKDEVSTKIWDLLYLKELV